MGKEGKRLAIETTVLLLLEIIVFKRAFPSITSQIYLHKLSLFKCKRNTTNHHTLTIKNGETIKSPQLAEKAIKQNPHRYSILI